MKHKKILLKYLSGGVRMENLRLLRESHKMSQQKLADQFGLAQSQIHGYETNAYEPEIAMLKSFANFFNTSIDYLVGNTEIQHKIEPVEKFELNENEATVIEKYRKLSANAQNSIMGMIDALLDNTLK